MKNFYFNFFKIFLILICFGRELHPNGKIEVVVFKNKWHTGIIFANSESAKNSLPALKDFAQSKFIDIGWGDEDFYQRENFNPYYATKAIVTPTSSVLRLRAVESIEQIITESDFGIRIVLTELQFKKFLQFLDDSFLYENERDVVRTSARNSYSMVFYKSVLRYHLFYTCNTWVIDALKNAGLPVSTFMIMTAEDTYDELSEVGDVVKSGKKKSKLFFK